MKAPKYIEVLKILYEHAPHSVHYLELTDVIFSEKSIANNKRFGKIYRMTHLYLGRLVAKDLIFAEYKSNGSYAYYVGHYIRKAGIELLVKHGIIEKMDNSYTW